MANSETISSPDLTAITPGWAASAHWETGEAYISDHCTITLTLNLHVTGHTPLSPTYRWLYYKADWDAYAGILQLTAWPPCVHLDDCVQHFTETILSAARATVPRHALSYPRRNPGSWWNAACHAALQTRNTSLRRYQCYKSAWYKQQLQRDQARLKRTVRQAKKDSWYTFCASAQASTSLPHLWRAFKKYNGQLSPTHRYPPITDAAEEILSEEQVMKAFYASFLTQFSTTHGPQRHIHAGPAHGMMDAEFTEDELHLALQKVTSLSSGPDAVTGPMVAHLPAAAKLHLLHILNYGWRHAEFPATWKHGYTILLPKPNADPGHTTNYRPITLLNHFSKTWERMVNHRLTWWLAKNNYWSPSQHGGIPGRGTDSAFATITNFALAQSAKRHYVAIACVDIHKAYDSLSHDAVLSALDAASLPPRTAAWMTNYMLDRHIMVKINSTISSPISLRRGVPQGAVLSSLLYNMATNTLSRTVNSPLTVQYIDDVCLGASGSTPQLAVHALQTLIPSLLAWTADLQLRITPHKSHFTVLRLNQRTVPRLDLDIGGDTVHASPSFKYLGVHIDHHLKWSTHIALLIKQFKQVHHFLCSSRCHHGGLIRRTGVHIFQALVYSKLRFATICISNARPAVLGKLDRVIHSIIRTCIGVPTSTNLNAVYVEAGVLPPDILREQHLLKAQYRLLSQPFFHAMSTNATLGRLDASSSQAHFRQIHLHLPVTEAHDRLALRLSIPPDLPPWQYAPFILHDSLPFQKGLTTPHNQSVLQSWLETKMFSMIFFTDASLDGRHTAITGWIAAGSDDAHSIQLPSVTSIFSAELIGIQLVLQHLPRRPVTAEVLICSDALSVLRYLQTSRSYSSLTEWHMTRSSLTVLQHLGYQIEFLWVPSHSAIRFNDQIDYLVSSVRPHPKPAITLCTDMLLPRVHQVITTVHQRQWELTDTFLRSLSAQPTLHSRLPQILPHLQRSLTLARVGRLYTRVLLHNWFPHVSESCLMCPATPQTVHHILLDCPVTSPAIRSALPESAWNTSHRFLLPRLLCVGVPTDLFSSDAYVAIAKMLHQVHAQNQRTLHAISRMPPTD